MKLYYHLKDKLSLLLVPVAFFALVSCGSYQYSGYEADGIYGESRPGIWEQQEPEEVKPGANSSYYKTLFAQQSQMIGDALEEDIFTDVESYSSNDGYEDYNEEGGDIVYVGGNAPWGNDPDTYTVNFYNTGFYSPWAMGWGYGYPYGGWYNPWWDPWFDPFWPGGGFWGGPYAYGGWNVGFGFGIGWGWGYGGYYRPWGWGGYYGNYYYNNYYNYYDNVAYNNGRRNARAYSTSGVDRRSTSARASSYSRSIREIRNTRSADYGTSRVRNSVSRNDNAQIYSRTNRRTESGRSYEYNRNSNRSPVYQRSSSGSRTNSYSAPARRSSSSTTRSSGSSSRSSGASRSSGGGRSSSRGGRGGGL
ncbi:hypothetical protein E0K83_13490 [Gramella sp. BOM4]|nr:hypothetical protein [Christiangramia bathymodioli]